MKALNAVIFRLKACCEGHDYKFVNSGAYVAASSVIVECLGCQRQYQALCELYDVDDDRDAQRQRDSRRRKGAA